MRRDLIDVQTAPRPGRYRALVVGAILLAGLVVGAKVYAVDPTQLPDPKLQERYLALTHELRCVQCQN